jgi:hypothetical protein
MSIELSPPPCYRSEAFAEDLEPASAPPADAARPRTALLALVPAVVALLSGAANLLVPPA